MLVASTAFLLGFFHGLGADHLLAIAALSVGESATTVRGPHRALHVAVKFACGHAMLLAGGALVAVGIGWQWPATIERTGETLAGLLLVGLGATGLWAVATGRIWVHSHAHGHPAHVHWHWHFGRRHRHPPSEKHRHLPTVLGAVFAVSGLRALSTLSPVGGTSASPLGVLALILLFSLGILSSMTLFGVVLARVLSSRAVAAVGRAAAFVTAAASFTLGLYWLMTI